MTTRTENEETGKSLKFTKRPLGQVLTEGQFVTPQELNLALEVQNSTSEPLGAILVRMGSLDPVDMRAALTAQKALATLEDAVRAVAGSRQPLGELLLRAKRITPVQFEFAFSEHKRTNEMFGEALLRLGYITSRELDAVLKFQQYQGDTHHGSINFRLGEIFICTKKITRDQLEHALEKQKLTKKKLGDVLVEAGYVLPHHVDWGLKVQDKLLTASLIAVLTLASVTEANAPQGVTGAHGSDAINATATVQPVSNMNVLRQTGEIVVTNSDIGRGYVDADNATVIEIKNNSPRGYALTVESAGTTFREVHISGPGINAVLTNGAGMIAQPNIGKGTVRLELSYRFMLSDRLRAGTYAWPLTISVNPL
jgi:hypothetical protein